MIGLLRARNDRIVLGGDGRADSAGHSAKYGTYRMNKYGIVFWM